MAKYKIDEQGFECADDGVIEQPPEREDTERHCVKGGKTEGLDEHRAEKMCENHRKDHAKSVRQLRGKSIRTARKQSNERRAHRDDGIDRISDEQTADKVGNDSHRTANERAEHHSREDHGQIFKAEAQNVAAANGKIFAKHNAHCAKHGGDGQNAERSEDRHAATSFDIWHKKIPLSSTYIRRKKEGNGDPFAV